MGFTLFLNPYLFTLMGVSLKSHRNYNRHGAGPEKIVEHWRTLNLTVEKVTISPFQQPLIGADSELFLKTGTSP